MFNASEDTLGVPESVEKSCCILSLGAPGTRKTMAERNRMSCYIPLGSYVTVYRDNDSDSLGLLLGSSSIFNSRNCKAGILGTRRHPAAHAASPHFTVTFALNVDNDVNDRQSTLPSCALELDIFSAIGYIYLQGGHLPEYYLFTIEDSGLNASTSAYDGKTA